MTTIIANRRQTIFGLAAVSAGLACPVFAQSGPLIQVVKDPDCGCCSAWIEIMYRAGFEMEVWNARHEDLLKYKAANGISEDMASCHTAKVEGYTIEGHVPPADVRRLLMQRPDAVGLSVPGMPYGSPGMGPESERDAYSVFLIHRNGGHEIFSDYDAKP